jgi:TatA/E family protein of Tat protein translocase
MVPTVTHPSNRKWLWIEGEEMLRPEPLDVVLIVLVGLLLFGANRLPETARALGKGIREFKDALAGKDVESEMENGKKVD